MVIVRLREFIILTEQKEEKMEELWGSLKCMFLIKCEFVCVYDNIGNYFNKGTNIYRTNEK